MNLAGFNTLDTLSTIGVCTYPVEALTGSPDISEDIIINGEPLRSYSQTAIPSPVSGYGAPGCETPQPRTMNVVNNSKVFFNNKLPALSVGSSTRLGGVDRPLTSNFQHANIIIGSKINN
tara:strand:+ start:154 stop:513 length:360 start_codon:yes stop_codon:yes gene_type:complete